MFYKRIYNNFKLCTIDYNLMKFKSNNLFEEVRIAKNSTQLSIRYSEYDLEKNGTIFLNSKKLKKLFLQLNINNNSLIHSDV